MELKKFLIACMIAFVLLIPANSFAGNPSYSIIKHVEKQELINSDLAVIEFFVLNNSEDTIDLTNNVFLTDSDNRKYDYSQNLTIIEDNNCMDSSLAINPQFTSLITLCFEIPKNDEDYRLNLSHPQLEESIPLYVNSHQLSDNYGVWDIREIFITIHDTEIFQTNIGEVIAVELSLYNGYYTEGKHGITNISFPLTKANIFLEDSNHNTRKPIWDDHLTGTEKEKCPKNSPVNSNEYKTITVCFDRPTTGTGSYDSELFVTINESTAITGCGDCQEKSWNVIHLAQIPQVENNSKEIQKVPEWVKNIFSWYASDQVSEDELLNAIKFLINEKILIVN